RELRLAQFLVPRGGRAASPFAADEPAETLAELQAFLRDCGPRLAVCRTPIDAEMHGRWNSTFLRLDQLIGGCRAQQLPLALVVVPSQFQVNASLCETLRRRMGYARGQLDLDLPQRRLMVFAEGRSLPVLDLLPYLRRCDESPYV